MSTNITPDPETGIGAWSYPAFERSMREGIHRDGRHLYPAFPYPDFAKASEADLQALYAFLMAEPAVTATNQPSRLVFPLNFRPLMAAWNLLFHRPGTIAPDTTQSEAWNHGRTLVDGLGHCGACHTPRNFLGAEKAGAYLAGGAAEGWDAPALTSLSAAPVPWTEAELFAYLRTGASRHHGAAGGPMAPVVAELRALPDADIRAMATYLASLNDPVADADARATEILAATAPIPNTGSPAARLYEGACAVCHDPGRGAALLNAGTPLALTTDLHAAKPDNLLRVIIGGVEGDPRLSRAPMPAFGDALDDRRIAGLARHLRQRFAPDKPAWDNIEETLTRLRAAP
jgi:nicotinate dehydrogenase subunit B